MSEEIRQSSPSPPSSPQINSSSCLAEANPQIAAVLSINSQTENQMQQGNPPEQFVTPGQPMGMSAVPVSGNTGPVTPGAPGGPIRVQQMPPQMRGMPYTIPNQSPGQPGQMRQIPSGQHFSPMNMNHPAQYTSPGQPIQIQNRPQMGPSQQQPMQMPHLHGMQSQPGPSNHPMGMGSQPSTSGQQQFMGQSGPPQMMQPTGPPQQPPAPIPQQQQQQPVPVQLTVSSTGSVLEKVRLDELMMQINKNTVLEENVKDALVEYADDFVTSVIDKACRIIKHRNATKIEARDIEFVLKNVYNMPTVPRASVHVFGAPETLDLSKDKNIPTEAHKQRLAMLKKHLKKI